MKTMNTETPSRRWCILAAGLFALSNFVHAASQLTFTDTWKDTGHTDDEVTTTGSFSTSISLPLYDVDLSQADSNSQFSLIIGPPGNNTVILADTLGDAESFSASKHTAKFALQDPNTMATIGSLTVSWTATTITVAGSASEDLLGEQQTFAANSDYTPTNITLNTSSTGVYYYVSLSLDASDNGGGTYLYDQAVPVRGSDRETEYNPPDMSGPYPLEAGSITGALDFTPPKLAISSPAPGFSVYNPNSVIELKGTASDSLPLTSIEYLVVYGTNVNGPFQVDQAAELPTNSIAWTASVDFSQVGHLGPNEVFVFASDALGNAASVLRTYHWIQTNSAVVTVNPSGAGKVTSVKNGQILQIGNTYLAAATPSSKNWIISDWVDGSGDILSSNADFAYVDTDGVLTANFVPNPFTNAGLTGTYTGLFYDTNLGVELDDAGYVTLTVTETGAFSGKLSLADNASPLAFFGQLSVTPDGGMAVAQPLLQRSVKTAGQETSTEYWQLSLEIATDPDLADPGAGRLGGLVLHFAYESEPIDSAEIQGQQSSSNTNILAGLYNVAITPAFSDPSQGPGGYSYGSARVGKSGTVALALNLADGNSPAISFPSSLARDGSCPFYASLYGGEGVILGWLRFPTNGSGTIEPAPVQWVKQPLADTFYPNGFTATPSVFGNLYLPPSQANPNVFGWTAGTFVVDQNYAGLTLPDETDTSVGFNPEHNTFSDTNKVTIALTPSDGALAGVFPAGGQTTFKFRGVELDGAGYGFYAGTNKETGPVWLGIPK
jgi:hypothetical protein